MILYVLLHLQLVLPRSEARFVRLEHDVSVSHIPQSGYVQTLVNHDWLDVSSSSWSKEDGDVACRQLGYVEAVDVFRGESYLCFNSSVMALTNRGIMRKKVVTKLNCTGSEVTLSDCPGFAVDYVEIKNYNPSGVVCAMQFSLRHTKNGILEILVDYQWEVFCGSLFNDSYANVACHQLGYEIGEYEEVVNQTIEGNSTCIYVNGDCTGNEFSLIGCADDEPYFPIAFSDCDFSVSLHCFSPVFSQPCHVATTFTSCNSADIEWSFPVPVDVYNIRYQEITDSMNSSTWIYISQTLNDTSSFVKTTLTNLSVLVTYKVSIQGISKVHGKGLFSDSITLTIEQPELPPPKVVQLNSVTEDSVNISLEVTSVNCSFFDLIGFDVQLSTNREIVTNKLFIDIDQYQLLIFNGTYAAHISYLKSETSYELQVRAIGCFETCDDRSKQVFSSYSQRMNVTTLSMSGEEIFGLAFLQNPYFSLAFFIATVVLSLILCVVISYRCFFIHKRKKKTKKMYKRRISTSDDNMYTAGVLSEQSYIPMNSLSVVGSMRTSSRVSVVMPPTIHGPKSLWIDNAQPVPPSTFTSVNERCSISNDNIEQAPASAPMISRSSLKMAGISGNEEYEYYDKIDGNEQENSCIRNNEEGDNVYDVIASQRDKEILSDEDDLPEPQTSQSQDIPTIRDVPDSSIPPPREFSALPQTPQEFDNVTNRVRLMKKQGLSSSMSSIPLPPVPNQLYMGVLDQTLQKRIIRKASEGYYGCTSDGVRSHNFKYLNERKQIYHDTEDKGHTRQNLSTQVSEQECYHTGVRDRVATAVSFGHEKTGRIMSPNYEPLVHPPQSILLESD